MGLKTVPEEHDGFLRIALASLRADTVADFELHLAMQGRRPILYPRKGS